MNLPNQITTARFLIALILFILLSYLNTASLSPSQYSWIMDISLGLFLIGAITDFLDGYIARKYNMVSTFGRIADPFVDKIIVCGAFIFLIPLTPLVSAWMVVIIIGREMLVSALRSFMEGQRIPFGAQSAGKFKMVLQCVAISVVFLYLSHFKTIPYLGWIVSGILWFTVFVTIGSAYFYIRKAAQIIKTSNLA